MSNKPLLKKIQHGLFHRFLGRLLFQRSDFYENRTWPKSLQKNINQFLNERGCQTPFILSKQECLEFWGSINNESQSTGNRPQHYAEKDRDIIDFLNEFWTPHVQRDHQILELGCNCGANLHWLKLRGYDHLSGIEINQNAVDEMKRSFPSITNDVQVHVGSIDALLSEMPDDSVDVIFTMGVAMHIHPSDNFIFKEMKRVAKKYVCTLEPESANSNYVFARNYRRVFARMGCSQLKSTLITKCNYPGLARKRGLVARLFNVY